MSPHLTARRALLAAALPAVLASAALPAGAQAASVGIDVNNFVRFTADPGETNNLAMRPAGSDPRGALIFDDQVPIRAGAGCTAIVGTGDVRCDAASNRHIVVDLQDRADTVMHRGTHPASIFGGEGSDTYLAGLAVAPRQTSQVFFLGGTGTDTMSYRLTNQGVRVDMEGARIPGGRPGIDNEVAHSDIEELEGSNFNDVLFGSERNDVIRGLNGNDQIAGGLGHDVIDEGNEPNGSDSIDGGPGYDWVAYGRRNSGVRVFLDNVANDGAVGENDNVIGNIEGIGGTRHDDLLLGNDGPNTLLGFDGNDALDSRGGDDRIEAGNGVNRVFAGTGNDVVFTNNGSRDTPIDCGLGRDTITRDRVEGASFGCERVQVGKLSLTPRAVRSKAGSVARVDLRWEHPQAWRKLRSVELRLTDGLKTVGSVTLSPRTGRITSTGGVKLSGKAKLVRSGKGVRSRLALRIDRAHAGRSLTAEVEAVDVAGRRQVERGAARIRVGD